MLTKLFQKRCFSSKLNPLISSGSGQLDVIRSGSNNIIMNLAAEEYMFEHTDISNPVLFLWRNSPTIILGKHQNPWKECYVQKLEEDGVILARRASGGGCVYQDLGNSVFSFLNPVTAFDKQDYKTMNNDILLAALQNGFGVNAEPSGRNDLVIKKENDHDRKISGSAYKLKLGNHKTGEGRKSLHHGTMLLNLELGALGKYLNPSKAKLQSKGVDSVISRVQNLKEVAPGINHETFCQSVETAFANKWEGNTVNSRVVSEDEFKQIPQLMEIYKRTNDWAWRFGETPKFNNSLEKKFQWALVDMQFDVQKGVITSGQCFSDCLVPPFIDAINEILATGTITYDVQGMQNLGDQLREKFPGDENAQLRDQYTTELEEWLKNEI